MDGRFPALFTLLILSVVAGTGVADDGPGKAGGGNAGPDAGKPGNADGKPGNADGKPGNADGKPVEVDRKAVDRAIERGVAWVRADQKGDGSWDRDTGTTALALLALAHSGVPKDRRAMERGVRWLVASLSRPDTYGASLSVMALATIDPRRHEKRIRLLGRLLAAGQCRNGQWSYQLKSSRSSGDNSNTQFAILALWYARRCGYEPDREVFEDCLEFFRESQNEDGGWGYSAKERTKSYGSMVATGLAALVIGKAGVERVPVAHERARSEPGVARAAAWLANHLDVAKNPEAKFKLGKGMRGVNKEITESYWRHYWIWSLERGATLAGLAKLGGRDWYAEGANHLLANQRDDGSWNGPEKPLLATCFALLFLSRSTKRAVTTEPPMIHGGETTPTPR